MKYMDHRKRNRCMSPFKKGIDIKMRYNGPDRLQMDMIRMFNFSVYSLKAFHMKKMS